MKSTNNNVIGFAVCLLLLALFVGCGPADDLTEEEMGFSEEEISSTTQALSYCEWIKSRCESGQSYSLYYCAKYRQYCRAAPACTDSDGGIQQYVRGTVRDANGRVSTDACITGGSYIGYVQEYSCSTYGGTNMRSIRCSKGCVSGHCIY